MTLNFGLTSERTGRGRGRGRGRVVSISEKAIVEATLGTGYQEELTRKQMSPNQLAILRLGKELGFFPTISRDSRYYYQNLLGNMEQLRYMNMKTLAGAIVLYQESNQEPTPEDFTDKKLQPIMEKILPLKFSELSAEEKSVIYQRYKQSLLRYVRALIFYIQRR